MTATYSSAEYPQSNGAAKRAVKILKRLKKVSINDTEFLKAVLYLQNTAKAGHRFSPADVFLGRTVRTPLQPRAKQTLRPWEIVKKGKSGRSKTNENHI